MLRQCQHQCDLGLLSSRELAYAPIKWNAQFLDTRVRQLIVPTCIELAPQSEHLFNGKASIEGMILRYKANG